MEPESSLPYSQRPPPVPILSQLHPVPTTSSHFLKIHINIIPHLRLGLPIGLFHSGFPTKTLCTSLPSSIRAACPAHLILLDFITRAVLGEVYTQYSAGGYFIEKPADESCLPERIPSLLQRPFTISFRKLQNGFIWVRLTSSEYR